MSAVRPPQDPVYKAYLEARKNTQEVKHIDTDTLTKQAWELYESRQYAEAIAIASKAATRGNEQALQLYVNSCFCYEDSHRPLNFVRRRNAVLLLEFYIENEENVSRGSYVNAAIAYQDPVSKIMINQAKVAFYYRKYLKESIWHLSPDHRVKAENYSHELLNNIKLSDENFIPIVFNAALALQDNNAKKAFNLISNDPRFIQLAIKENWEDIVILLTKENAERVYNAIKKLQAANHDAMAMGMQGLLPGDVAGIISAFSSSMHPSYSQHTFVPDPLLAQFEKAYKHGFYDKPRSPIQLPNNRDELQTLVNDSEDINILEAIIVRDNLDFNWLQKRALFAKAAKLGSILGLRYAADARNYPLDPNNLDLAKIQQYCEKLYALGDFYATAYLGQMYFDKGDFQTASIYFREALKRESTHTSRNADVIKFSVNFDHDLDKIFGLVKLNPNNEYDFTYCFEMAYSYHALYPSPKEKSILRELRKLNYKLYWELDREHTHKPAPAHSASAAAPSCQFFSKAHETAVLLQEKQLGKNVTSAQAAKLQEIIEQETKKAQKKLA